MKNLIIALAGLLFFILSGCNRDDAPMGPALKDTYADFGIVAPLTANRKIVNFASGETVQFNAKFKKITPWTLIITGQTSKITFTRKGKSNFLDASNAQWNGNADHPKFSIEDVRVVLKFDDYPKDSLVLKDPLTIGSVNDLNAQGILVSEFDTWNPGFSTPYDGGKLSKSGIDTILGGNYMVLAGQETSNDYMIGNFQVSAKASNPGPYFPMGTTDPDAVYFNIFIYGYGNPYTSLEIGFQEDDLNNPHPGAYNEGQDPKNVPGDDSWNKQLIIDWVGWKLVSFKLSETQVPDINVCPICVYYGGGGNHKREIDRILRVNFVLSAVGSKVGVPVNATFDYAIFTNGKPLQY